MREKLERLESEFNETYRTLVEVESEKRECDEQLVSQLNHIAQLQVNKDSCSKVQVYC